jgi:pimeloyl-ACP methyl ester carboxylesterase
MIDRATQLLLLPGSLCDEWLWHHQIAALRGQCTILVPHFMEYDHLQFMAQAVLKQAPPRFALAGFSMGGRVALEVLRAAPERVERLALLDATVHPVKPGEDVRRQQMLDLATQQGMAAVAAVWVPKMVLPAHHADTALMADLSAMLCRFTPEEYQREMHALLNRPDARTVLPLVRCPTLVMAGRQDPISTPAQNEELAAQIPGAQLELVDHCGHFLPVEAPIATTQAFLRWLDAPDLRHAH